MTTSLFSTYSTGENRVTAAILAVLGSLALHRTERLLGALLEESEFTLVQFSLQPSAGAPGVPDAEIKADCRVLVETKIRANAVHPKQLKRHLARLRDDKDDADYLLVLTPDGVAPQAVKDLEDDRMAWASFALLDQAINDLLGDAEEVISEREAFLLRELQKMLAAEGLVRSANDTVVVAAREAWRLYPEVNAYICQPDRPFRPVERIAFYTRNQIHPFVPKIREVHDNVVIDPGQHNGLLRSTIEAFIKTRPHAKGRHNKVMLLSPPDDPETIRLDEPVCNDLKSDTGRTIAFTQGQRYVRSERLKIAATTSELLAQD